MAEGFRGTWVRADVVDGWQAGHATNNLILSDSYFWCSVWRRGVAEPMTFKFNTEVEWILFVHELPK